MEVEENRIKMCIPCTDICPKGKPPKMFWLVLVTDNIHIILAILKDKVPNIAANIAYRG